MLGHHSWAKNREPYANGMKAIFTAAWILFCLKVAHESMVLMNVSTRDKFFLEVYLYYNPVCLMVSISFTDTSHCDSSIASASIERV
jgi:hypothetical protein